MSLGKRTLLVVVVTLAGLLGALYVTLNTAITSNYDRLEAEEVKANVARLTSALSEHQADLVAQIDSRAHDDALYAFAQAPASDRPPRMATGARNPPFDLVVIADEMGGILFAQRYDSVSGESLPLPEGFETRLDPDNRLLLPQTPDDRISGITTFGGVLTLAASGAILPSDGTGPRHGVLILARSLDAREFERLQLVVQGRVDIQPLNGSPLPADYESVQSELVTLASVESRPRGETEIAGYGLVPDVNGDPVAIMRVTTPRTLGGEGRQMLTYILGAAALAGAIIGFEVVLLNRRIVAQIRLTVERVRALSQSHKRSARLEVEGDGELAALSAAINETLDAYGKSTSEMEGLKRILEQRVVERTSELQEQRNYLQAILDSMHEGVIYGTDDHIEYVNHMMATMSGYAQDEFVGKPHSFLFGLPPYTDHRRPAGGRSDDDTPERWVRRGERKLRCKDGTQIDIAYTITPLDGGDSDANIYLIRDVTEDKAQQARRDRFLAHASHELRTPLTNLMTRLYLLRRQPEQMQTHLEILDSVAAHMKSLVEDLLDVSRFQRGTMPLKRERLSLQSLIREVVNVQEPEAQRKNIALTMDLPETPVVVYADRKRMVQVLTNLVINAIHYTPANGHVTVELATEMNNNALCSVLRVRDDGIGMSSESLAQIFQPFFRVSQETPGSGLGLTIIKEIIDRHGGEISVESTLGQGSVFSVRLAVMADPDDIATQPVERLPHPD